MSARFTLHGIWLSGPTYKVALMLSLCDEPFDYVHMNLAAGAHKQPAYMARQRFGQVPLLEDANNGRCLSQAAAILEYLADLRSRGADVGRYVGTHPMAGREKSGPVAARGELFTSMPWVVCPAEETLPESLRVARALAGDLGAVVSEFAADEHDAAVALVSHLPQVMSSLVASRLQGTPLHALSLAGNGLRDVTRIAASDPTLWVQILGANAEKVVEILHGVREDLNRLIGTLEAPTAPGARLDLAQLISEGNAGQSRIPGKHGGPPQAYSWLTVLVDDTPGQIAKLLTEIGEIGVNVEDLRLDHSSGQNVGMVEISVLPNKHDLLIEALNDRGWRVLQ